MVDNLPWVLGGDFNEWLRMDEKCGGLMKVVSGMYDFRKIVDNCNLMDLGFAGPKMTWDNKREGRDNIQERLDRFFGDCNWVETFSNTKAKHLGFNFSDHRPILLSLEVARKDCWEIGDKGFRFEPFWLKDEKCTKIVEEAWNNHGAVESATNLKGKLAWCAGKLKAWSVDKFGSFHRAIEEKQAGLEALLRGPRVKEVQEKIVRLEKELEELLTNEELYWRQ
ncbi:hypothetical protein Ddye_017441 [Dipteronia dyeriana]|uniref:Endonuclease/exonuclease/phosphatase domain-containing protein n=1 Tax=Dipteronia dyeriana TaxID=168575 RepID=A0AAD9X169_9ROSI|nr:hypothetical protein Ddye_017441 [Dipteronia dyeriana]